MRKDDIGTSFFIYLFNSVLRLALCSYSCCCLQLFLCFEYLIVANVLDVRHMI